MSTIKILIMGDEKWIASFKERVISLSKVPYSMEMISDKEAAKHRLEHNSYDILILEDGYFKENSIKLATMAYAMSRPTLIICENILTLAEYTFQKMFSSFFNRYQISKKLICVRLDNKYALKKLIYLAENHKKISKNVTSEISNVTNL